MPMGSLGICPCSRRRNEEDEGPPEACEVWVLRSAPNRKSTPCRSWAAVTGECASCTTRRLVHDGKSASQLRDETRQRPDSTKTAPLSHSRGGTQPAALRFVL